MRTMFAAVVVPALAAACAGAPAPPSDAGAPAGQVSTGGGRSAPSAAAEPFTGFLDRDDVTVRMAGAGLIVDIVPMNGEVVSLATDDLRVYLEESLKKIPDTVPPDLRRDGTFFLVGFSATEKEISFEPTQVQLNSEGRRYYPRYIVPVSAGFDSKVLQIFSAPVWAVYIYDPGVDLVSTIEFAYGDDVSTGGAWRRVVQRVEEARGRAGR